MLKVTIKNSECQDFFGERNNSVESSVKSYYRRKDISLSVRTEISLNLLEQEGQYGVVTPLAAAYGVSRTFLYNLRETARGALEMALASVRCVPRRLPLWAARAAFAFIHHRSGWEPIKERDCYISSSGGL